MNRVYHNKRFKRHNQKPTGKQRQEQDQWESDKKILVALGCTRDPEDMKGNMPYWREQYREKFGTSPKFLFTYTGYIDKGE